MARPVTKNFEMRVRVMAAAWDIYIPSHYVMAVAWLAKLRLGSRYRSACDIELKAALKAIAARGCLDPDAPEGMLVLDRKPDLPPEPYFVICTICADQFESQSPDLKVCSDRCLRAFLDRQKAEYQRERLDREH